MRFPVIALKKLKLGYPVKPSNTCQRLLNVKLWVHVPVRFSVLRTQRASGPETAAISRSATVRFIIRYVLRLRSWRVLAKIMRVKALIINIRRNSVSHTPNQMFFVALVDIVEFNLLRLLLLLYYFLAFWIESGEIKENGTKYETN